MGVTGVFMALNGVNIHAGVLCLTVFLTSSMGYHMTWKYACCLGGYGGKKNEWRDTDVMAASGAHSK